MTTKLPTSSPGSAPSTRIAHGLAKIGLALRSHAWQEGFHQDLTPTQGQVLSHLVQRDGSTLNEVADALAVRASTASEAVAVLERKGLLRKERSSEDGRRLALHLTTTGKVEAGRVATWPDFLASIVDELPADEQALLLRMLQRMIRELQQRGNIPLSRMCSTCQFFRPYAHPDPALPHHCAFLNVPIGDRDLRMDCPEQVPATGVQAEESWQRFVNGVAAG